MKKRNAPSPKVSHEKAYEKEMFNEILGAYSAQLMPYLSVASFSPYKVQEIISALSSQIAAGDFDEEYRAMAFDFIKVVEASQAKAFNRILKSVSYPFNPFSSLSPAVKGYLTKALGENVGLIKKAGIYHGVNLHKEVAALIEANPYDLQAIRVGVEKMLDPLSGTSKHLRNRARLIARDQNNKIVGKLNEIRHQETGGERYIWMSSEDARVRSNHAALDGKEFYWDAPPVGGGTSPSERGHPGSGIQCRCWAQFIFE